MSCCGRLCHWKRRIWTTAIVLGETLLLLALAEAGLRLWGAGHSTKPFLTKQYGGETWYLLNDRYYSQFINAANIPQNYQYPSTTVVKSHKEPGTYRIVLFGGSAAYGWFFDDYSMGRLLESMLRYQHPECQFEVITVAFHAMNSFTMRYLADACARMEPDLFLVYMGNNEMTGPYGLQSVLGSKSHSAVLLQYMVRMNLLLSNLRLFQLFGVPARDIFSTSVEHLIWGAYAGVTDIDDPRLERVHSTFRNNLERICEAAHRSGAQTALCTVGYNLRDWRPTTYGHRKSLSMLDSLLWKIRYDSGKRRENKRDFLSAIYHYERAAEIDNTHANLLYDLGRCHWAVKNYPQAHEYFLQAADNALSFCSANTRINAIISETAASRQANGVRLIDIMGALATHASDGIPGSESFYDHVHLTFEGNYIIAREILKGIEDLVYEKYCAEVAACKPPPSLEQCMQRMGYSSGVQIEEVRVVRSVLNTLPDNPILPRLETLQSRLEKEVGSHVKESIADGYRQALALDGVNNRLRYRYVSAMNELGHSEKTLQDLHLLIEKEPANWQYRSSFIYAIMGREPEEALQHSKDLLSLYPEFPGIQAMAGNAALNAGDADQAIACFKKATALEGENAGFHVALGQGHAMKGDFDKALTAMEHAIDLESGQADAAIGAIRNTLFRFQDAGNWREVVEGCQAILQLDDNQDEIRLLLINTLCELRDFESAWNEVAESRRRSIVVPQEVIERLTQESGYSPQH